MFRSLTSSLRRLCSSSTKPRRRAARLSLEPLEQREVLAASIGPSGILIQGTAGNDYVSVSERTDWWGNRYYDVTLNGTTTSFWSGSLPGNWLTFYGFDGNDTFVNNTSTLRASAYGGNGNDYLVGGSNSDYLFGEAGNDVLSGGAGNDYVYGGAGDDYVYGNDGQDYVMGDDGQDVVYGGNGNDYCYGGNGNDRLYGGAGADTVCGDAGDDTLVSIDGESTDRLWGGAGRDSFWTDENGILWWYSCDTVCDADGSEGSNVHRIGSFANGADRTLDGDSIADPLDGSNYRRFYGPLFAADGPRADDVRQGALGDCWLMAGMAAVARTSQNAIRQTVVDLGDYTYAVELGGKYYRVDGDLPTNGWSPSFAQLGRDGSLWAPLVEKAYAYHRTAGVAHAYWSLTAGTGGEAMTAMGASGVTSEGFVATPWFGGSQAVLNSMARRFSSGQAVTLNVDVGSATLVSWHVYTVVGVNYDAWGNVASVVVRNPWGVDGAGNDGNPNDGLVTLTAANFAWTTGTIQSGYVV